MLRVFALLAGLLTTATAAAIHLDVAVSVNQNDKLVTAFCLEGAADPDLECDRPAVLDALGLPEFTAPVDIETGQNVFIVTFDLNLPPPANPDVTPNATDDLGFVAPTRPEFPADSTLPGGLFLKYEAVGHLMYWDPSTGEWSDDVPGSTQVTLSGGLQVVEECTGPLLICIEVDLQRCNGQPCETNFRESGITGDPTLALGETFSDGGLHVHPNFFLEDFNGTLGGPPGAYMIEMRVTADGFTPSEPFFVMLFKGLNTEQEAEALISRIGGAIVTEPAQVPALPPLYVCLLLLLTVGVGIRRSRSASGR